MKKVLAIALVMAMLSIMAVSGTLSYFTSTDGQANIMAVGNVQITQMEFQRDGEGGLVAFTATKLYPYTGDGTLVNGWYDTAKNAVDKIVTIKNTGSEDAFIRTLFAFEAVNGADPVVSGDILVNYNTTIVDGTPIGTWAPAGSFTNDSGVTYYVYSFTYSAALAANSSVASDPSLKQIALKSTAGNSFSDGRYDILVLSQAVQSQGFGNDVAAAFTAAFPITELDLKTWFASIPTP